MKDKNTRIGLCALGALIGMFAIPAVQADPVPLEERLQLCAGCHNPDGNSAIPENPKLAGLHAKYLQRQLEDFKSGDRTNDTMAAIIPMVDESEFKALAKYFSEQKRLPGALWAVEAAPAAEAASAPAAADAQSAVASTDAASAPAATAAQSEQAKADMIAKGMQIYTEGVMGSAVPACMGCHGEDGTGSDKFPYIGSQNNVYVVNQLKNFANGTRTNDPKAVMRAVAKRMTEEEMVAVAEYIQTLKEAE